MTLTTINLAALGQTVNLGTEVTGTLPTGNGGTGSTATTFVNAATNVTGTLPSANLPTVPVTKGGTGLTSGTTDQFLKFTGTTTVASSAVSAGITEADTWRITTNFQGNTSPITANWERDDTYQNGNMGTGMSQSSGIFTFPSTGFYLITFNMQFSSAAADNDYILNSIQLHDGASSYSDVGFSYCSIKNSSTYQMNTLSKIMDITNTSNQKVCFKTSSQDNNHYVQCDSNQNATYAMFIKLGAT